GHKKPHARAGAHLDLLRTLATATTIMNGSATLPTTICDSAAVGAWYVTNSTANTVPKRQSTIAWDKGSRVLTTINPSTATIIKLSACNTSMLIPPRGLPVFPPAQPYQGRSPDPPSARDGGCVPPSSLHGSTPDWRLPPPGRR